MYKKQSICRLLAAVFAGISVVSQGETDPSALILTPPPPASPRINGPSVFGVRPGSPFLYTVPATGKRPVKFGADNLPKGLQIDSESGRITGTVEKAGEYHVVLKVRNKVGSATRKFRIVVGDEIALTPPMGWNSWNSWAHDVDQEKVIESARILVSSGLINHGWSYVNIDDTWQGKREGKDKALLANDKFPDMEGLCASIHDMGLKAGIYSTPWMTSYANFPGGTADNPEGEWSRERLNGSIGQKIGPYHFTKADARQFAAWGFDYLKYDWNPNDVDNTREMFEALRSTGRDIVFSLSNSAPFDQREGLSRWSNVWRTTGDIWDHWEPREDQTYHVALSQIIDANEKWAETARPGHWNDPDMLVVGWVSVGSAMHPTKLTPDEQYAHISMWCMMSAPLLIGCDLTKLDDFTMNLLTNDEVLALNQDSLGKQAVRIADLGTVRVYRKPLEDGSSALCFLNMGEEESTVTLDNLADYGLGGKQQVRDLWRQLNLKDADGSLSATVRPHGVMLFKLTATSSKTTGTDTPFKTPLKWTASDIVVGPLPDASHPVVAVKDPSIVRYKNKWHIYATTASTNNTWSMQYTSFRDWKDAAKAKPFFLDENPNLQGYHCAPQVFYFTPQKKWYMVYQSQQPQYSTTDDLSKPETWSKPENFFEKMPDEGLRLDYWVICDDTHAYLFATGDDGNVYRSRTKIEDFPKGMSDFETVISGPRNDVFEGGMTYKIKGTDKYLTLVEAIGPARYYRAWISDRLDGEWTEVEGANNWETPFAGMSNVTFADGVTPWTTDISHGELIREGYDEIPTIDPNHLQLLFQGYPPSQVVDNYILLPYTLGLLTLDRSE